MAWVSMREGLVQFDNGTEGVKTIGVITSKDATAPGYAGVKDLPGFYTRKTKADGTPRTVYLSMTDQMTVTQFNTHITVSVDGQATGFVNAIAAAPEILHPNTKYYVHFYEIADTTGTAIEKLEFTTEDFPAAYPTSRGTYSSFYNQITDGSTSPAMEYKASESYLMPLRYHYFLTGGGPYVFTVGVNASHEMPEISKLTRPFGNTNPANLVYDLYNITLSGPGTSVSLWDGMIKLNNLGLVITISYSLGGSPLTFYRNKKAVLVTE
ncbi:hypothetical protein P0082_06820 [Candidatus Haliotispira prima]|uniref:Virion structural protein n=1 Tax=Candidatus Haliotispira prima TaxID=3034016 RepID=A0ABY8ME58_9SPIO|nr:hypothetical protein P0082_06820 [Candidatus Haliotispira prima]